MSCIAQDKAAICGSARKGGVSKYDGNGFTNYTKNEGLPENDITSFLQDKAGSIWLTTQGGGVSRYDGDNTYELYCEARTYG